MRIFETFKVVSENYAKPILENKKLTILIWCTLLTVLGFKVSDFMVTTFFPDTPIEIVAVPVEDKTVTTVSGSHNHKHTHPELIHDHKDFGPLMDMIIPDHVNELHR